MGISGDVDHSLHSRPYGSSPGIMEKSFVGVAVLVGVLYAAYFEFRYNGLWVENDTSVFNSTTKAMLQAGTVFFPGQYAHGPGYPAWLGVVSLLTGWSPMLVNTLVAPFFGISFAMLVAYLLYRRFLRTERAVAFACFLLFLVPEVMFTVLRGNHEKINVSFIMLAFYGILWFADAAKQRNLLHTGMASLLYYVSVFMNGITNDYFGMFLALAGFLTAVVLTLTRRAKWMEGDIRPLANRLWVTASLSGIIMVWVMVFFFPQSSGDTSLLFTLLRKLKNLAATQQATTNPYAIAGQLWITPSVNDLFSAFHLALIATSGLSMVYIFFSVVLRRRIRIRVAEVFLIGIYVSLALLVVAAIPADLVGLNAGTNLELRNYTYFALFAPPVIVMSIGALRARFSPAKRFFTGRITLGVLYVVFFSVGLLKGTVEPALYNVWMGYSASEREALTIFESHTNDTAMWAGTGNRLVYLYNSMYPNSSSGDQVVGYSIGQSPYATDIMLSPLIRGASIAQEIPLPSVHGMDRLVDAGGAQIYKAPTTTPFQY